jgi:hypothetical protein
MKIIFFKENITYVLDRIHSMEGNYCAFWYTTGLTSYRGIESIVNINEVHIEECIAEDFSKKYPEIIENYPISIFRNNSQKQIRSEKIAFFASNDTMVFLFRNLLNQLPEKHWSLFCKTGENAYNLANQIGVSSQEIKNNIPNSERLGLLVMANDWGLLEQKLNYDFVITGKNTVCLQESVIDFNIAQKRMLHCSLPIYQGVATLKCVNLKNKICAVIGNPRYEKLKFSPLPNENQVLLNVNFTYGVHEDARQGWVDDIVKACADLGLTYCISQHPRDRGDFSAYHQVRTNAASVHDVLRQSSVLVTRFSSLIHEALCLGRPVIYYNPHGETLFYDFEADGKSLVYASNSTELCEALARLTQIQQKAETLASIEQYLPRHLGVTTKGEATSFLQLFLHDALKYPPIKTASLYKKSILSLKIIKRRILKEKL